MQRVVRLFPTMLLAFSLMAGCSSSGNKPQIPDEPLEVLYKQAQSNRITSYNVCYTKLLRQFI